MMILLGAVGGTVAVLLALGAWLFPRPSRDHGAVEVASLPWRDYEDAKRKGCVL